MKKNSRGTALSAIACAFSVIALTAGTLYSPLLFTGYLIACLCMTLPLSKGYFKGAALCFIATNVLTLLFNGFNFFDTLPYTLFFGLHPLVNEWQLRLRGKRGESGEQTARSSASFSARSSPRNARRSGEEAFPEFANGAEERGFVKEEAKESAMESKAGIGKNGVAAGSAAASANGNVGGRQSVRRAKRLSLADVLFWLFKTIWFDVSVFFIWKVVFAANTAIPFIDGHIFPVIAIGGTLFFIVYDLIVFRLRINVGFFVEKYVDRKK